MAQTGRVCQPVNRIANKLFLLTEKQKLADL